VKLILALTHSSIQEQLSGSDSSKPSIDDFRSGKTTLANAIVGLGGLKGYANDGFSFKQMKAHDITMKSNHERN
jgi:hypothetical protein